MSHPDLPPPPMPMALPKLPKLPTLPANANASAASSTQGSQSQSKANGAGSSSGSSKPASAAASGKEAAATSSTSAAGSSSKTKKGSRRADNDDDDDDDAAKHKSPFGAHLLRQRKKDKSQKHAKDKANKEAAAASAASDAAAAAAAAAAAPAPSEEPLPEALDSLLRAVRNDNYAALQVALPAAVDAKLVNEHGRDGLTALCIACIKGSVSSVRTLMATAAVDVTATSRAGLSPLLLAARFGRSEVVSMLLTDGRVPGAQVREVVNTYSVPKDVRWQCSFAADVVETKAVVSQSRVAGALSKYLARRRELLSFVPLNRRLEVESESLLARRGVLSSRPDESLGTPEEAERKLACIDMEHLETVEQRFAELEQLQVRIATAATAAAATAPTARAAAAASVGTLVQQRAQAVKDTVGVLDELLDSLRFCGAQYRHALELLEKQKSVSVGVGVGWCRWFASFVLMAVYCVVAGAGRTSRCRTAGPGQALQPTRGASQAQTRGPHA